ncbi:MAG: SurA N-terminal domain-containing protein [Acidothermus sp.]|nr:SurA N-terminal domain-containing protein [Acidothermus sp.]
MRLTRMSWLVPVLVAAGVAVSACGPVHPGAAATVGNTRITDDQVQKAARVMLEDSGTRASAQADLAGLRRDVLSRLIKDELLSRGAALRGVTVSEADVQHELAALRKQEGSQQQLEQAAAAAGIAAADLHDYLYYYLMQQRLADALTKGRTVATAHVEVISVTDKATADTVLAKVRQNLGDFPTLARQYSKDQSAANGGDVGQVPIENLPEPLKTDIANKPLNTPFLESDSNGYYIIVVLERGEQPLSALSGTQLGQQIQQQALSQYLASLAARYPITVSPRYGVWDATSQTVVPAGTSATSLTTPAPGTQTALPTPSTPAG